LKKIALFGGTFNPIHYGHLRLAEEVREGLGFDLVVFVPAAIPPHKGGAEASTAQHRLEMTRIATEDNPGFEVSEMEIRRGGPSYTVETLRELKKNGYKGETDLATSLIIGGDSFNDITTWCEYEEILTLASLIVVERPQTPVKKIAEVLPERLARKYWYDSDSEAYQSDFGTSITYLTTTLMAISSSEIRERVREGLSIRYLLPREVAEYIMTKRLYA